jgi:hypothetical protein
MVIVAQLVRASDCGSEGRGFETRLSPFYLSTEKSVLFFISKFPKPFQLEVRAFRSRFL